MRSSKAGRFKDIFTNGQRPALLVRMPSETPAVRNDPMLSMGLLGDRDWAFILARANFRK
jgi:hypothetical protein